MDPLSCLDNMLSDYQHLFKYKSPYLPIIVNLKVLGHFIVKPIIIWTLARLGNLASSGC